MNIARLSPLLPTCLSACRPLLFGCAESQGEPLLEARR
ncbi:uncharacterized protein METZ01_LOCUS396951, partial [marine metagenome]